jgi:8-oxo-dGTP pyrophosphatase MutT (NUDIX family)
MAARNAAFDIRAEVAGDRRVKFIASTRGVDRHGTRLLPRGCKYDNYMKNPVFIWNHRKHEEAEPEDVIGQAVAIDVSADAVTITIEFDTAPKAQQCLRLVRLGFLRAVSVGFIPLVESPRFADEDEAAAYLARGGVIEVREWELCELSLTIVPSNPDALKARNFTLRAPLAEVAAVMVHRPDGCTLWGRRRDSGLYTTPAGKLNPGEAPEAGAARELFEEAGLRASDMRSLGIQQTPRARVHCFRVDVPADAQPTAENDPDREVAQWEWLPAFPPEAERQHKPDALVTCYAAKTARTYSSVRVEVPKTVLSRGSMDPKIIFEKLGIAEGVKPEEAAAALIKYLAGPDSDADKQALVLGLLSMLVPAPAPSAGSVDDGKDVAMEAMADEMRKLQARVVELEGAKVEAEKKAEPTPEMRADMAIRSGQWPEAQRSVLVSRYTEGKPVHLFAERTFVARSATFTSGGNPVGRAPNFGGANPDAAKPAAAAGAKSIFDEVSARLGRSNGTS